MDAPDADPAALRLALDHLATINRLLRGYAPSLAGIAALLPPGQREFTLLDVGCGSADTPRRIADWAARRGLRVCIRGIELSPITVEHARAKCHAHDSIAIDLVDLFDLPPGETYDIVHCALVLHHMGNDAATARALRAMADHARIGVVVNDLHRHPLARHSIALLTRLIPCTSPIVRHDAPLSVERGFTRNELAALARAAGCKQFDIRWCWAFRWLLTMRK